MKIYILAIFTLLLCSCSDDPLSESIVGTWELQSVESTGCDDPEENIPFTEVGDNDCLSVEGDVVCNVFYTFLADGTATQTVTEDSDTNVEEFTYTVNDDNDTILLCDSPSDCATVRVDGDTFTISFIDDGCNTAVVYKKA